MFSMADYITAYVIQNGLNHLAANPDHCRYILGAFSTGPMRTFVSMDHINQAVEFVTKNEISVTPYYEMDNKKRANISIVSSGSESDMFIGDFGHYEQKESVLTPVIYAKFDIKSIDGDTIKVPRALNLEDSIWPNVILTNGSITCRLLGIQTKDDEDTTLFLDTDVTGAGIKGWQAQSLDRARGYTVNASMDNMTVQLNLTSTGHASVHRLLVIILRYCLKRGRMLFDNAGLQVAKFSYTPLIMNDDTELEFQTVFTMETKSMDCWIENEFDLNDDTKKLVIDLVAVPVDTDQNDEVDLS